MKIFKKILGIVILAIIYGSVGWFTINFIVTSVRCGESLLWSILKLSVIVIIASLIILIMNFAKILIGGEVMKHECLIGMYNNYEDTDLITYSKICEKSMIGWELYLKYEDACIRLGQKPPTPTKDYFDKRKNTELTRFDYCPVCGKKIDWNELKRRCKE